MRPRWKEEKDWNKRKLCLTRVFTKEKEKHTKQKLYLGTANAS